MDILESAGLPPGVINMVPGAGAEVGDPALASPDLAGIHFTGSTATFQGMWETVGRSIRAYRSYPRIVGERSEEHTSELQSLAYLVCRLLLEKKKKQNKVIMVRSQL